MQYSVAALLALAGAALAQTEGFDPILSPGEGSVLQAGDTFTIEWEPAPSDFDAESVDILLLAGETPSTLSVLDEPVAEGIENSAGSFEWDIPSDLGEHKTYGLKIQLSSDPETFQFSFPFEITPSEGGDEDDDESTGNSTATAKPTKTATGDDSEETGDDYETSSFSAPKTITTVVDAETTAPGAATPTVNSPDAGAQATAGAFALVGGLAIAALAL